MRKIKSLAKNVVKTILFRFSMPLEAYNYLAKGKKQIKRNNVDNAIAILTRGANAFPNNYQIRAQLVDLAMREKKWKLAIQQWERILEIKAGKLKEQAFLRYSSALQNDKRLNDAEKILFIGLKTYPKSEKILHALANHLSNQKKWKAAATVWQSLLEFRDRGLVLNAYRNLAFVYIKLYDYQKAEAVLQDGLQKFPNNKKLRLLSVDNAIYRLKWSEALQRIEETISLYEKRAPMNLYIKASVVNQIAGSVHKANQFCNYVLENYKERLSKDKKGYRKFVIFNNGETRIEFNKKLQRTETIVITFDSLNMVWKNPSFAFKLLSRQNVDILAVRKKRPKSHHQDLSIEEFKKAVHPMIRNYHQKVAYGYSLGGYCALYYGSSIDRCTILSLAPRLSIHPRYGKPEEIEKFKFKHSLKLPSNLSVNPIIAYDPKQKMDNTFVKEEIVQAFPNAELVEIPYGGHGIAPHLLRMGQLKEFVLTVVNDNEIPKYNRKKKIKSNIYFRVLGQACLRRNKLKWAMALAERSLELLPTDKYGIKLKVNVLKRMGRSEDAIQYLKSAIKLVPKSLDIRESLIDLYLQIEDFNLAEKEINKAVKDFGELDSLVNRLEILIHNKSVIY
ncbi:tetratricopeptide repeat protein [Pueribacillus sp. YX66]|uniref:tetratricopeptide repeat protein n=1 Tax=Pueribacillus sp. YX66 TaxID=3229242 RepID=UPI00358D5C6B